MPNKLVLSLLIASFCFTVPGASFAKGKGKKSKSGGGGNPAKPYDTNANGFIDGDEVTTLQTAFGADPTGPLKAFDTSGDGTLDAAEVAAIHFKHKGKKKAADAEAKETPAQ